MKKKVIVIGAGNAALCAGITALEKGADVLMLERANKKESGATVAPQVLCVLFITLMKS